MAHLENTSGEKIKRKRIWTCISLFSLLIIQQPTTFPPLLNDRILTKKKNEAEFNLRKAQAALDEAELKLLEHQNNIKKNLTCPIYSNRNYFNVRLNEAEIDYMTDNLINQFGNVDRIIGFLYLYTFYVCIWFLTLFLHLGEIVFWLQ